MRRLDEKKANRVCFQIESETPEISLWSFDGPFLESDLDKEHF